MNGGRWDVGADDPPSRGRAKGIALLIVTLLGTAAGSLYLWRHNQSPFPPALAGEDARLLQFMQENQAAEARQWLDDRIDRALLGMTREQSSRFVDRLYDMGSKRVIAYGGQMAATVIVELPDNSQQRKAIFQWQSQRGASALAPPARDVGQRYLLVGLKV